MRTDPFLRVFVLAAALALSPENTAEVSADTVFGSSCFIQTTPFFNRLETAGVFDVPAIHAETPKPMILLFRMALSFHYAHDAKKEDNWQSADETTKYFSGDCEDKAIWLYTHMRRNGYKDVSLHIGKYAPSSRKLHMWVSYVDNDRKTMLLDPTNQRKPWTVESFPSKLYRSKHILNGSDCVSL
jgi:hypothetical protein